MFGFCVVALGLGVGAVVGLLVVWLVLPPPGGEPPRKGGLRK